METEKSSIQEKKAWSSSGAMESKFEARVRKLAEDAASAAIKSQAILLAGALGLSGVAVVSWVFFTLPDQATNKALAIIESRTINFTEKLSSAISQSGSIQGQILLLNDGISSIQSTSKLTIAQLGEIKGTISTYESQLASLKLDHEKARVALIGLETQRAELAAQIASLTSARASLDRELAAATSSVTALRTNIAQADELISYVKGFSPQEWRSFRDRVAILSQAGKEIELGQRIDDAFRTARDVNQVATAANLLVRHERYGNESLRRELDVLKSDAEARWRLLSSTGNSAEKAASPDLVALGAAVGDVTRIVRDSQFGNEPLAKSLAALRQNHEGRIAEAEKKLSELSKPKPPPSKRRVARKSKRR